MKFSKKISNYLKETLSEKELKELMSIPPKESNEKKSKLSSKLSPIEKETLNELTKIHKYYEKEFKKAQNNHTKSARKDKGAPTYKTKILADYGFFCEKFFFESGAKLDKYVHKLEKKYESHI